MCWMYVLNKIVVSVCEPVIPTCVDIFFGKVTLWGHFSWRKFYGSKFDELGLELGSSER